MHASVRNQFRWIRELISITLLSILVSYCLLEVKDSKNFEFFIVNFLLTFATLTAYSVFQLILQFENRDVGSPFIDWLSKRKFDNREQLIESLKTYPFTSQFIHLRALDLSQYDLSALAEFSKKQAIISRQTLRNYAEDDSDIKETALLLLEKFGGTHFFIVDEPEIEVLLFQFSEIAGSENRVEELRVLQALCQGIKGVSC